MCSSSWTNLGGKQEGRVRKIDVKLLLCVRMWGWAGQGPQGLKVPVGCRLWAHLEEQELGRSAHRCLRSCRWLVYHEKLASAPRAAGQATRRDLVLLAQQAKWLLSTWACLGFGPEAMQGGGQKTAACKHAYPTLPTPTLARAQWWGRHWAMCHCWGWWRAEHSQGLRIFGRSLRDMNPLISQPGMLHVGTDTTSSGSTVHTCIWSTHSLTEASVNDRVCADSRHKHMEQQAIGGYWTHKNGFQLWKKLIAESPGRKTLFPRHPLMVTAGDKILD